MTDEGRVSGGGVLDDARYRTVETLRLPYRGKMSASGPRTSPPDWTSSSTSFLPTQSRVHVDRRRRYSVCLRRGKWREPLSGCDTYGPSEGGHLSLEVYESRYRLGRSIRVRDRVVDRVSSTVIYDFLGISRGFGVGERRKVYPLIKIY